MRHIFTVLLLVLVSACTNVRHYETPAAPEGIDAIDLTDSGNERLKASAPVEQWWTQLQDPKLDGLINDALDRNLDVQIAIANLLAARAIARKSGFDRYPTITSSASYSRERLSEEGIGSRPGDNTENDYRAGLDGSWTLDLFGRVSQGIALQEALRDAAIADLHDVYINVAAEVAATYVELRGAQYRLDIARRNAGNQQKTYGLTVNLAEGGRSTNLDVARARTQLDLTLAGIPQIQAAINGAINRLSVLTGSVPDTLRTQLSGVQSLPSLPVSVTVGNAPDLLKRRPDIRRAERQLASTVAQYNVVAADLFPRVDILGSIGFIATSLSTFGTGAAVAGNIGPSLSWAAFDLGRVRARIDEADSRTLAALAVYERTVLLALEQLHTALSDFSLQEIRRERLRSAARSSAEAAALARQRFEAGIDTFLDVLDAERTQLEAEDALAVSETRAALDLVRVYLALGGGWEIKQIP